MGAACSCPLQSSQPSCASDAPGPKSSRVALLRFRATLRFLSDRVTCRVVIS